MAGWPADAIRDFWLGGRQARYAAGWPADTSHRAGRQTRLTALAGRRVSPRWPADVSHRAGRQTRLTALAGRRVSPRWPADAIRDFSAVLALDPGFASAAYARGACRPQAAGWARGACRPQAAAWARGLWRVGDTELSPTRRCVPLQGRPSVRGLCGPAYARATAACPALPARPYARRLLRACERARACVWEKRALLRRHCPFAPSLSYCALVAPMSYCVVELLRSCCADGSESCAPSLSCCTHAAATRV